jgi:S-DNA-T family DNA segregation ATPase FtsK/SpoIIIE
MNRCTGGVGDTRGKDVVRRASTLPARRPAESVVARAPRRRVVVDAAAVVGRPATHERTRQTVRWLARNAMVYPVTGMFVLLRRWWEARTNARYERLMRAAEAAGDYERLTDWEARAEQARERRHRRRMDWILAPLDLARAAAVAVMSGIGVLLGLGAVLAIAHHDTGWLLTPLQKAVDGVAWVVWLLGAIWLPVTIATPWLVLAGLWQLGRRHGRVPRWAAPAGGREQPTVIVTRVGSRPHSPTWGSRR